MADLALLTAEQVASLTDRNCPQGLVADYTTLRDLATFDASAAGMVIRRVLALEAEVTRLRAGRGYYETLTTDDQPNYRAGHVCNMCGRPVDDTPCPDHAPTAVPGLVKVECGGSPGHHWWTLAGDRFVPPCPWCLYLAAARTHAAGAVAP